MNGVEQIRESREGGYWGQCLEAERHVDYLLSEVDRLQVLVAQAAKYQAVVAAARALLEVTGLPFAQFDEQISMAEIRLRDALAAYEREGGG